VAHSFVVDERAIGSRFRASLDRVLTRFHNSESASECSTSKESQWSRACIALNRASSRMLNALSLSCRCAQVALGTCD
jgi:hypothetical protein